ncbi:MAG: pyridoxamine 5'-phosphate oxidase [bacterium]|nr:pyridoxamine 5'-phosphate oxidase [bacterium]
MDISTYRQDYQNTPLTRDQLHADPVRQFSLWFQQACEAGISEPNAMSLATVAANGQPSLRTVLLKFYDEQGFVFYTNFGSRKAKEMAANQQVALLFPWVGLARQITITGTAGRISTAESARYFASRPRESQLGAWVSRQSEVISSRRLLLQEFEKAKKKFLEGKIPLPDFWGGYRVVPTGIEFWQGQTSRLHDRFLYRRRPDSSWTLERLAP